jgi:hypothetical protein
MHAALQQHWYLSFAAVNWLHIPVALRSMLLVASMVGHCDLSPPVRRPVDAGGDRVAGAVR